MNMMGIRCTKDKCTGCGACYALCPTGAITMCRDEEGFLYPDIDNSKCIECKICNSICPSLNNPYINSSDFAQEYYAAQHMDEDILAMSSSGGVYSALSEIILRQGGVVYGVSFSSDYNQVIYDRVEDERHIDSHRGSKYVQADFSDMYGAVYEDIVADRFVMVSGTPCQISGLKSYLTCRRVDCSKLYTCDCICHGVASPKIWSDYISNIKKGIADCYSHMEYSFRDKTDGWHGFRRAIRIDGRNITKEIDPDDAFFNLYSTAYIVRPSCYSCQYSRYSRCSDITMGDFWNVGKYIPEMNDDRGTSEVLVNTAMGKKLLDAAEDSLKVCECSMKAVWQPHLEYPSNVNQNGRKRFWNCYYSGGFDRVSQRYGRGNIMSRIKRIMVPLAKKTGLYVLLGRIYRVFCVHVR